MITLDRPVEMTEAEIEEIMKVITDAPECKCESKHRATTRTGKSVVMPTPCTGEASFKFVWPNRNLQMLVCSAWASDFNQWGLVKEDGARVIPV